MMSRAFFQAFYVNGTQAAVRRLFKGMFIVFASKIFDSRISSANVHGRDHWLGFFTGPGFVMLSFFVVGGTFLNVFCTDVVKATGFWGDAFLMVIPIAPKIIDAITNIIMRWIIDRTRNRQGKARLWILISGTLVAITDVLLFTVPSASNTVKMFWSFISYNLFFSFAFTIYNMSHTLMVPLSTRNTKQRDALALFNNLGTAMVPGWITVMCVISIIAVPSVLMEYYFT